MTETTKQDFGMIVRYNKGGSNSGGNDRNVVSTRNGNSQVDRYTRGNDNRKNYGTSDFPVEPFKRPKKRGNNAKENLSIAPGWGEKPKADRHRGRKRKRNNKKKQFKRRQELNKKKNYNKKKPNNHKKRPYNKEKRNQQTTERSEQLMKTGHKLATSDKNKLHVKQTRTLEEQQQDLLNPLCGRFESFDEIKGLNPNILKGLHNLRFSKPSKIQEKTIPAILDTDNNLIAQSQSGTGKTACFAIAALEAIDLKVEAPQVIIVCHATPLARQTTTVIKKLGQFMEGLKVLELIGSTRIRKTIREQVICGTPGSIRKNILKKLLITDDIKLLILDEADEMLQSGNGGMGKTAKAIRDDCLRGKKENDVRIMLFSATFQIQDENRVAKYESKSTEEAEKKIKDFARVFVPKPRIEILIPKERLTLETLNQYWIPSGGYNSKFDIITEMYNELTIGQSIIFMNTKDGVDRLAYDMTKAGHTVSKIHSRLDYEDRKETLDLFKENKSKVLISTDMLARGFDVSTVTIVINFDVPFNSQQPKFPGYETYLHRIGRTARFGGCGASVTLVEGPKMYMIKMLEDHFATEIVRLSVDSIAAIKYKK